MGDGAAAYCSGDDTIFISEKFATDIYTGALDRALPGSANGYGGTAGDFAVAYIVAHEYGHQIQDELGLFKQYGVHPDHAVRAPGRLLRRHLGPQRLRRPAGGRAAISTRRSTPPSPSATSSSTTRATTAPPNSAARPGCPASSPAIPPPARSEPRYRNGANRESTAKLVRFPASQPRAELPGFAGSLRLMPT